ncbi:tetratricopeptide repeat protein [Maribacter sp. MAR_2009_72]|uniref:ATP-binding protein n=1 Tax=Maribacter sp. MAR_2009_72 TaxID=1250050 RepID=UPI001198F0AF|nr:tetratricopeptide repeat protein [Maribacter sp. MAR_2009_72]TVZ14289.1 tetratricopeptide repeat protein [Maribacter sp. MAR_2009_72]
MKFILSPTNYKKCILLVVLSLMLIPTSYSQSEKKLLKQIEELKAQPEFNPETPLYIDLLFDLAKEYTYKNKDSTYILANQGLALSKLTKYKKGEGYAYLRLGDYYSQLMDKDNYKKYYDKAIEIADNYDYEKLKLIVLNNYGTTLSINGDVDEALKYYLEGIEIGEKNKDNLMLPILYDNIAIMYSGLKDYETALIFHENSLRFSEKSKSAFTMAKTLSNMAFSYAYLHKFENAEDVIKRAIPIFIEEDNMDWLSFCYEVKGIIALEKKQFEDALEWYMESNLLCEDLDYFTGTINTYNGLAEAYIGLGQIDSAEHYALKANKAASTTHYPEILMKSAKTLADINRMKGEFEVALDYQDEYLELAEKADTENFKKGLAMLRSYQKYEAQKKQILDEKNRELASQQALTYIALSGLLLLIIMLVLIYRNFKIQGRFNGILQKKQQILVNRELQLKESNNTKDKLFSLIAHDLRGPIHSFHGLMEFYVRGQMTKEETDKFLPVALQDLSSIADMLDNLLIWGKTQINGTKHEPKNININDLIENNMRLLKPLADKKSIQVKSNAEKNLVSYSDDAHVDIVLRNLIGNAIKFTHKKGEITIDAMEDESQLVLSVADNGVGMSPEKKENLFNKNNYESTYGTNNEKGTGLGLFLCKEMVEMNGGRIWVKSVIDQGSTIYFTVPKKLKLRKAI